MIDSIESEIRSLVRELIRDVVPESRLKSQPLDLRRVRLDNDEDLAEFVNDILAIAAVPSDLAALQAGQIRFTLANSQPVTETDSRSNSGNTTQPVTAIRVEKGAVTEKAVIKVAESGSFLKVGPNAVLTPLAREAARKRKVRIERLTT